MRRVDVEKWLVLIRVLIIHNELYLVKEGREGAREREMEGEM